MTTTISIKGLRKEVTVGGKPMPILRGIHLEVQAGEFLAIMGPSGSGKSTLLGLMAGLDVATDGSIKLAGEELTGRGEDDLARLRARHVGIVFQAFHLLPTLTTLENVALPLELAGHGRKAAAQAVSALQRVGLGHRLGHYPRQLSGGEQQRVAVARATAPNPAILFADEPTGNLDSKSGSAIMDLLLQQRSAGATLVLVTHDPALGALADRILYLQDGAVVREEVGQHARMAR